MVGSSPIYISSGSGKVKVQKGFKPTKFKSRRRGAKRERKMLRKIDRMFGGTYNGADPFKPTKNYKMKYVGVHTLTVGTSGVLGSIQEYNLNSLYDCDETGGGHQPYGFDVLALAYNRYKVNGAKVTVRLTDPTIDAMNVTWQITNPSNASATITGSSPYTCQERQMCGSLNINNTGSQKATRSFYIPMWRGAGISKLQFKSDVDNYTAPVTGDPGNKVQFQIACADLRGGSTGTIMYEIEILYYATLYQRKIVAQS